MRVVIETGDAPLDPEQLAQLRSAAAGKTRAERGRLIPGVGREGMAQALAGLPVRPATRALIRLGLERLANIERDVDRLEHYQAHPQIPCRFLDHDALGDSEPRPEEHDPGCPWVAARMRPPVCPRCLDLTPGTPGGTPDTPHPGPFTGELCAACEKALKL